MKANIFYHMYCVPDCIERFVRSYNKIKYSGLIDDIDNIYVIMVGDNCEIYKNQLTNLSKIIVPHVCGKCAFGEMNTIKFLHNFCQNSPNSKILYLHSKGATKSENLNVRAWVDYMEYFLIENYSLCLDSLNNVDAVGLDYYPAPMPHFSGNFWWANSNFIKSHVSFEEGVKNNIIPDPRWYCEFWLLHDANVKYKCLHSSGVDLYGTQYTKDKYALS